MRPSVGQPRATRPGEVLGRARVVRRGRAAGRRDHRLDAPHRLGQVEVGAVERGDGVVHHRLQTLADLLHALDGGPVACPASAWPPWGWRQAAPSRPRSAARPGSAGTPTSPRRRRPRAPARRRGRSRSSGARPGRSAPGRRRPACPRCAARRRPGGSRASRRPPRPRRGPRRGGRAARASGAPATKPAKYGPAIHSSSCATTVVAWRGATTSPRRQPSSQRLAEAAVGLGHPCQPAGDDRPVGLGRGGHHREHLADGVDRAEQVVQRQVALARLVHLEVGSEPFPQQPGAAPLDRVVVEARVGREDGVELGERRARQLGLRLHACRAEVGQPVVTRPRAELGRDDRVDLAQRVDEAVGDRTRGGGDGGRRRARCSHRIRSSRADIVGSKGLVAVGAVDRVHEGAVDDAVEPDGASDRRRIGGAGEDVGGQFPAGRRPGGADVQLHQARPGWRRAARRRHPRGAARSRTRERPGRRCCRRR